jgi:hypothetical protein
MPHADDADKNALEAFQKCMDSLQNLNAMHHPDRATPSPQREYATLATAILGHWAKYISAKTGIDVGL